jgi:hypothetical protein
MAITLTIRKSKAELERFSEILRVICRLARSLQQWPGRIPHKTMVLLIRQENSGIVFPPISAKNAEMDGAP